MNLSRRVKLAVALAAGIGLLALAGGAAGAHMGPTGANARHASSRCSSGTRRSAAARTRDEGAQRRVPEEVPGHQDQPRGEVVHRPAGDAEARGVRAEPAGRRRGEQRLLRDGAAREGEPAALAQQVRAQVRLERPLLDRDPADEPVHRRREELRHGQPLRPADDRRGRRRLLQQGEAAQARSEDADDVRGVRAGAREGEGRGRDADPVRQPRQVAGDPRVRGADAPVREQVVRAELHLRHRRREDATSSRRAPSAAATSSRAGRRTATSRTATPVSATTRRGRRSARARASS